MRIKEIKSEIDRIAKIEDPESCQTEVRILDERIKDTSVKVVERTNYAYFFPYEVIYDSRKKTSQEKLKKSLGRMSIEEYHKNKAKIKAMSCKELKTYLKEKEKKEGGQ